MTWAVVVPTVGRPSLERLLASLRAQDAPGPLGPPVEVVVVDDRPLAEREPLAVEGARVVRSGGRGPAAARNAGWRGVDAEWVVFLDDDVVLPTGWALALADDLAAAGARTAGVQARLHVPLGPTPATDWERSTAGLEGAAWATADMAYRRAALAEVDGFDERFPRAYREDADLALRVRGAGWDLVRGTRTTLHPVRPARDGVSVRVQAGNADDALLRALHGRRWRDVAETGRGRGGRHVLTVGAAVLAVVAWAARARRAAWWPTLAWAALTGELLWRRLAPGPRPGHPGWAREWTRMAWTTLLIPPVAVAHRVRGTVAHRRGAPPWRPPLRAVLFDRDGTLVHDVPYATDPGAVEPVPGARAVLDALRDAGIAVGVVSNQSGIARGLQTPAQVAAVNAQVERLVGPFGTVQVCPHGPDDACACRKPAPGLVLRAARELGVAPWECAVVGDIGADVACGLAAGAVPVLVPTPATRADEVAHAMSTARVTGDLRSALDLLRPLLRTPDGRPAAVGGAR